MILPITNKVGDFVDGEVITGQISGAKGIVALHLLRCKNEVNPVGIIEPVHFKAVFEPAGIPPADRGIVLISVEGTFQDGEQVIGGISGASADVDDWTGPQNCPRTGYTKGWHKEGLGPPGERTEEAQQQTWANYDAASVTQPIFNWVAWGLRWDFEVSIRYRAGWGMFYAGFDTESAKAGFTSAKLHIDVKEIVSEIGTPIYQMYQYDNSYEVAHYYGDHLPLLVEKEITGLGIQWIDLPLWCIDLTKPTYIKFRLKQHHQKPDGEKYNKVNIDGSTGEFYIRLER